MRVFTRIALTLLAVFVLSGPTLVASHFEADCPLQLVGATNPPLGTPFFQSPHGAFRFGNLVFVLRGQALSTYSVNDLGDIVTRGTLQSGIAYATSTNRTPTFTH